MNEENKTQSELLDELQRLKNRIADLEQRQRETASQCVDSGTVDEVLDIIRSSSVVAITWQNAPGWPIEYVTNNVDSVLGYTQCRSLKRLIF
ncbi:MAG: hypothetical protein JXR76_16000 [Deltaproteobacteria bacterium]|nr:hypothetical protein [Deltaproteobacteria bacterium]